MSDNIFNRPRRQFEPRPRDERGRDFADQSRAPDQGGTEQRDPGADALSELARLISDRNAPIPGRPDDVPSGRLADVSRAASSPAAGARDSFIRPPGREQSQLQDRPREGRSYEDQSHEDRSHRDRSSEDWSRRSSLDRGVRRDPDFGPSRVPVQPIEAGTDHSEPPHAADDFDFLRLPDRDDYAVAPRDALADGEDYDLGDGEGSPAGRRHPAYGRQHDEYTDEYADDAYRQDADGEYEPEHEHSDDGQSGARRRSPTKVAVAVLALAVFGSAAAFGYRTIFKAAPSGPTPIIRADNSPTKITPAASDANAQPANGRSGEQLVRRDEDPVDVASTYRSAVDAGTAGSPPPVIVPATVGPAPAGDAKRVRTVPIRVDQSAATDRTSSDRTASRAVPPQPQPQSQPPAPPPQRQAAASPPPSYSPPPAESRVQVATAAPEAAAPRAAVEAGGFVVQLSAQRSEADAQAAFRTLQGKYSALSGREPLIRRKDLGERGIFFAAQVGPFGVKSDADQLCETLKAAGGACFVQKN
jgi:hypothetical protein